MGLLDKKEGIFDIILTDKGREMLSKGLLEFKYYAFSDEGVDYKALSDKSLSGSLDNEIYKSIAFEADQRTNELKQPVNNKLSSFLFTIPNNKQVIPQLKTSKDDETTLTITRKYYTADLEDVLENGVDGDFISVIGKFAKTTPKNRRSQDYVLEQFGIIEKIARSRGVNTVGALYDRDHIVINSEEALNVTSGVVDRLAFLEKKEKEEDTISDNFFNKVDVVTGLDSEAIICKLKDGDVQDGFLIEVFESGSDGYTKLESETVRNLALGDRISEGFDRFLDLGEINSRKKKKKKNSSKRRTNRRVRKKAEEQ